MDAAPPFIKHQITLQLIRRPRQLLEHPRLIFGVCWGQCLFLEAKVPVSAGNRSAPVNQPVPHPAPHHRGVPAFTAPDPLANSPSSFPWAAWTTQAKAELQARLGRALQAGGWGQSCLPSALGCWWEKQAWEKILKKQ